MDPLRRGRKEGKEGRKEASGRKEERQQARKERTKQGKKDPEPWRNCCISCCISCCIVAEYFLLDHINIYIYIDIYIYLYIYISIYIFFYIPSYGDQNKSNGRRFPHCPAGTLRSPFVELLKLGDRLDHCLPQVASTTPWKIKRLVHLQPSPMKRKVTWSWTKPLMRTCSSPSSSGVLLLMENHPKRLAWDVKKALRNNGEKLPFPQLVVGRISEPISLLRSMKRMKMPMCLQFHLLQVLVSTFFVSNFSPQKNWGKMNPFLTFQNGFSTT